MINFIVFENDPLVRADVIEIIGENCPEPAITVVESQDALSANLSSAAVPSVVVLSATKELAKCLFTADSPLRGHAFVAVGDEHQTVLPSGCFICTVTRPFSDDSLSFGVRSALSFLRLCR